MKSTRILSITILFALTTYLMSGFASANTQFVSANKIMLAQDFNTKLTIEHSYILADSNIHSINYEEDMKQGPGQCTDLFQASVHLVNKGYCYGKMFADPEEICLNMF